MKSICKIRAILRYDARSDLGADLILKKHGLPHIRFHELRHSCASMLLNEGFTLKDVQVYMGHADISMTADIYGHLDVGRKDVLTRNIAGNIFQ